MYITLSNDKLLFFLDCCHFFSLYIYFYVHCGNFTRISTVQTMYNVFPVQIYNVAWVSHINGAYTVIILQTPVQLILHIMQRDTSCNNNRNTKSLN